MATRSVNGLLTSVDSLFTTQEERDEAKLKKIYDISISEIDDFPEHPYQVNDDEDMDMPDEFGDGIDTFDDIDDMGGDF